MVRRSCEALQNWPRAPACHQPGRSCSDARQPNTTSSAPGAVQLKLEVEPASGIADSGDPEQDLSELLIEIGEVARTRRSRRRCV